MAMPSKSGDSDFGGACYTNPAESWDDQVCFVLW